LLDLCGDPIEEERMPAMDTSFRIGGEAGPGVESSGAGFALALTRAGLQVMGTPSYYERIRGGHNFFTIRAVNRREPVLSLVEQVDVLIALNSETIELHAGCVRPGGAIVADEALKAGDMLAGLDVRLLALPLGEIAVAHGNALMSNTAALAVAAAVVGLPLGYMLSVIQTNFGARSKAVAEANTAVAQYTYGLASETYGLVFEHAIGERKDAAPRLLLGGNVAFGMGAVMSGLKFVAGYPMTPSTSLFEYLAGHADQWGLVVKHAEDEISAVNMCVGASHAGVRALTATSGGGFDLMVEGVSLAAITENPLVVYLAQRPGPATGLATRTAQADLLMAIHASHGEFPRMIIAPHTPEEHFRTACRALNIADKYQCLVMVLSDQQSASTIMSRDKDLFDPGSLLIERGKWLSADELDAMEVYHRYALTDDGVSPRAVPGSHPKAVFLSSGNEHREDGHLTEDPATATAMADKRLAKRKGLENEVRPPLQYGPAEADLTLVSWGSSYGPVLEAMNTLNEGGHSANMVHFVDVWPFPTAATREALTGARRLVCVEGNATAQLAWLIHAETGIAMDQSLLRYDGRGFTGEYILAHLEG
jgi:2-oxoglutarate ferredoxin oxidoreductase subunit alpha